jgi:hypothetical protein
MGRSIVGRRGVSTRRPASPRTQRTSRDELPRSSPRRSGEDAHRQLLVKEKELSRARDALAAERRRMPWQAVGGKACLLVLLHTAYSLALRAKEAVPKVARRRVPTTTSRASAGGALTPPSRVIASARTTPAQPLTPAISRLLVDARRRSPWSGDGRSGVRTGIDPTARTEPPRRLRSRRSTVSVTVGRTALAPPGEPPRGSPLHAQSRGGA